MINFCTPKIGCDGVINIKRERRKKQLDILGASKQVIDKNVHIKNISEKFEDYPFLNQVKELYKDKLNVINKNDIKANNDLAVVLVSLNFIFTAMLIIFISVFINLWYVLAVIGITTSYLLHCLLDFYLNFKLKKLHSQFPAAIQIFTDIYMSSRNIKMGLNESYKEMPKEISVVFERLSRELASSYDYEKHLRKFAKSLGYVWGYAFTELLLMSYEGGGDISEDLIFLNELINDDIQDSEETKSEMATNKMLFIILMIATAVAFISNVLYNPVAKSLYFYTPIGNTLLMMWVIVMALGITATIVLDNL